ncbi:hypothetical protein TI05_02395 [Achromatium sp. WMS3]|nr:hypothetical protein TI05_02395 [Achromatium sp. WMS3]
MYKPFMIVTIFLVFSMSIVICEAKTTELYEPKPPDTVRMSKGLFNVSAGAILGIIVFNVLAYPIKTPPFNLGLLAVAQANSSLISPVAAAIIGSAAAFTAHYVYVISTRRKTWPWP